MQRVLVILLSALDALVAAAVGVAASFAPLMVLWFVAFGATDWSGLWPTAAAVWQLGHAVPLHITIPDAYLAVTGIDPALAHFVVSLAPLGFGAFTAFFASRSGARSARAGAWMAGTLSGALVFAVLAVAVGVTGRSGVAAVHLWQAVLFPAVFYAAGLVAGAVSTAWGDGDGGIIDAVQHRLDRVHGAWPDVPSLAVRGAAIATIGVIAAGALVTTVTVVLRGGQVVALSQAANLDLIGVIVLGIAQLLYLPTLIVWAVSFVAGPGFAVGADTAVSAAGTQLGVVPGIPLLGALPETTSPWLYALVLLPVAAGAFAGWALRSRLAPGQESPAVRLVLTLAVAVLTAAAAALLSVLASGALGPGRLAEVGPGAGPVALAIGLEVAVGAGILLLGPRSHREHAAAGAGSGDSRPWTDAARPRPFPAPTESRPWADVAPRPWTDPVEPSVSTRSDEAAAASGDPVTEPIDTIDPPARP
jgi:hypothetical protein